MTGALSFVATYTIEGWRRGGYRARSMFISELSLGPQGWIQVLNFVTAGALVFVFVFGRGLAAHLSMTGTAGVGPVLVQVIGLSLLASGPFRTDPSAMFDQISTYGRIHGLFGAVVFSLAPVSCFALRRRFRSDPAWGAMTSWSGVVGVVTSVGVGVLKVSQLPGTGLFQWRGLIQRAVLTTYLGWLFFCAARLREHTARR